MTREIIYLIFLIIELILSVSIASYLAGLLYSSLKGAPYVPTEKKVIDEMLKAAELKKGQLFLELGSGDGRIVCRAVKKYGVRGLGVEVNPLLVQNARLQARLQKLAGVKFVKQNIFNADLKSAEVIYLFLMPKLIKELFPKFQKEIKKGALVISHGFKIENWENKLAHVIRTKPFPTYYYRV